MTLQEILQDFETQRGSVQKNIQTLQTQLQEQNQLFLKIDGAVDATKLIIANFDIQKDSDIVDAGDLDAELTTTPESNAKSTRSRK
jgi:hypothetical protein